MGMSAGGPGDGPSSDINVTPLVDVCLVLLIIFMVMVPKQVPEISVRVPPESKSKTPPSERNESIVIGLTREGTVTINRNNTERSKLGSELSQLLKHREGVVFIDFDDDASYGDAIAVMDIAKRSGAQVLGVYKKKEGGQDLPVPDTLVGL